MLANKMEKQERKYKYRKPSTQEEIQEAMYEELSEVSQGERPQLDTLKDYISAIYRQQQKWINDVEIEKREKSFALDISYLTCGFIGILLVYISTKFSSEYEFIGENSFFLYSAGIVCAALFIAISIERFSLFHNLLKHTSPKLVVSLLFTATIVYATSVSAGAINSVFGIDSSSTPFARIYLTGIVFFQVVSPFFFLLIFPMIVGVIVLFNKEVGLKTKITSGAFIVCALIVLWYSSHLRGGAFSNEEIFHKAYQLVHKLDFSDRALCLNSEEVKSGFLFVGVEQNRVLIDDRYVADESLDAFLNNTAKGSNWARPQSMQLLKCN